MAEEGPADARRHMLRGVAAIEMAKTNVELTRAVDEFRRATELDPSLSAAWYNLGSVQSKLGQFDEAIENYKRYLTLVPKADDAQKIQDEIVKLEFRQELGLEKRSLQKNLASALWWGGWTKFKTELTGESLKIAGSKHLRTDDVEVRTLAFPTGWEEVTPYLEASITFASESTGSRFKGIWKRDAFTVDSACKVPADGGVFEATMTPNAEQIAISFSKKQFRVSYSHHFLLEPKCMQIEELGMVQEQLVLYRVPSEKQYASGVEVYNDRLRAYTAYKSYQSVYMLKPTAGSTAEQAGLRDNDVLLVINGKDVRQMDFGVMMMNLYAAPGTIITMEVGRRGETAPVKLNIPVGGVKLPEAGIGIMVSDTDFCLVSEVLSKMPADRAGINAGDRIVSVEGKSTKRMTKDEFIGSVRGPIGSSVTITVERKEWESPRIFKVIREGLKPE